MLRIVLILALTLTASTAWAQVDRRLPFVTIGLGQNSGIREQVSLVVRDRPAWQTLWARHARGASPAPAVDFSLDMVIAVFAGEFTEPAAVRITQVVQEPSRLIVLYRAGPTRSQPDGIDAIAPFHMVRLPRSTLPVEFRRMKTAPVVRQP